MNDFETSIKNHIERLRNRGTPFEKGLSDEEVAKLEAQYCFSFPSELRCFLQIGLPVSDYYPPWRRHASEQLQDWFDRTIDGILFEVEHRGFWWNTWGKRPIEMSSTLEIARHELSLAPRMIPFGDRNFLKCIPEYGGPGNPVFSINQTDALHAGRNFLDFLNWFTRPPSEFESDDFDPTPVYGDDYRRVPFWTDLVRYNISV